VRWIRHDRLIFRHDDTHTSVPGPSYKERHHDSSLLHAKLTEQHSEHLPFLAMTKPELTNNRPSSSEGNTKGRTLFSPMAGMRQFWA
jgi:hypothetical protein